MRERRGETVDEYPVAHVSGDKAADRSALERQAWIVAVLSSGSARQTPC